MNKNIKIRNVLIFPCGTEIGLEIFKALKDCKEIRLFGGGQDLPNHAKFLFNSYLTIPSIHEIGWVESLNKVCSDNKIDYIFPAYDDVIVALAKERKNILSKIIAPSIKTCEITRSKSKTYKKLKRIIKVPKVYSASEQNLPFPLFLKPDRGQGSLDTIKVTDNHTLDEYIKRITEPIICEYLPGQEYTVDCFSDRKSGLIFAGPRIRNRIRNGIAVNTQTVDLPEATAIAQKISNALKLRGAWFFQLKRDFSGELTLLEVAPRIAGSMATNRVTGVNFPLLSIYEIERIDIKIIPNKISVELDRALTNRYRHNISYSTIYVDLDDTLIINNKINTQLITLIYQNINKGKRIILITKHIHNITKTLNDYRIHNIFDEIIQIPKDHQKFKYIKCTDSIFIDDSFSERMEINHNCNIPTFDCSMIELLIE